MKRLILFLLPVIIAFVPFKVNAAGYFSDVPGGHWAQNYIESMRQLGVTRGMGDGSFGLGRQITRAEFTTMLVNLLNPGQAGQSAAVHYSDVYAQAWYYDAISVARSFGFVDVEQGQFRPGASITREEMAIMIINSLGYRNLAVRLDVLGAPFADVSAHMGHVTMARDLGIISGMSATEFAPAQSATREQAVAMMMRMHNIMGRRVTEIHAYYAVAAFNQVHMLADMTSVSFGWSLLETDGTRVWLNTGAEGGNEFRIPSGYEIPWNQAAHANRLLMIAVRESDSPMIINNSALKADALNVIADVINNGLVTPAGGRLNFCGVSLNFEALRGAETRSNYTNFMRQLRARIGVDSLMYVTVQPPRRAGHVYFDGYDFRAIGDIADRVILMAHDYNARVLTEDEMARGVRMTALAPLDEVYFALRALTDSETGVRDTSKIMLQLNFASAQWKTQNGVVIHPRPFAPSYEAIANRIRVGTEIRFDENLFSPFITFFDANDNTDNIVWFEDVRSVEEKIRLAGLFSVQGISLWRLGLVPDFEDITGLRVYDAIRGSR